MSLGAQNPSTVSEWEDKATELGLDPLRVDITTHESHSASKFTQTDFIHLRALWRNHNIHLFKVRDHVREEHVNAWDFVVSPRGKSTNEAGQGPLQAWMMEFIRTCAEPLTDDDDKNVRLGAFLLTKSNVEAIKGINDNGNFVGGDLPKIRRPSGTVQAAGLDDLAQKMRSMALEADAAPDAPGSVPKAPRTPSPHEVSDSDSMPGVLATKDLAVISPESMALEKNRSRDEDSVNATAVGLLEAVTLCSGTKKKLDSCVYPPRTSTGSFPLLVPEPSRDPNPSASSSVLPYSVWPIGRLAIQRIMWYASIVGSWLQRSRSRDCRIVNVIDRQSK